MTLATASLNQSQAFISNDAPNSDQWNSSSMEKPLPMDDVRSASLSDSEWDEGVIAKRANYADALVQHLGHEGDHAPSIGQISVENSSDVHFGDKNIFQGPVTIKQVVVSGRDNLEYEREDIVEGCKSEEKGEKEVVPEPAKGAIRKGFIWMQNVSKRRPMEMGIFFAVVLSFLIVLFVVLLLPKDQTATSQNKLRLVTRQEWVAQPPTGKTTPLVTPVSYVIIHHTATENCTSRAQCVFHVRQIQTFHIESQGWYDIGYNFLVGGDGAAYEGRGWTIEGAHTFGWNDKSIGIAFIGTFLTQTPPALQFEACKRVIELGVNLGYIKKDYKVMGARQLFGTESPGLALYEEIKNWNNRGMGIAFVGTFISMVPPDSQLTACKRLIEMGVNLGYIRKEYKLLGGSQMSNSTISPGAALLQEITKWDRWSPTP